MNSLLKYFDLVLKEIIKKWVRISDIVTEIKSLCIIVLSVQLI